MRYYRKKKLQPMTPWTPDMPMEGVSVSGEDNRNGSPKEGDMIAVNPDNPADRWLVAKKFIKENYELVGEPVE